MDEGGRMRKKGRKGETEGGEREGGREGTEKGKSKEGRRTTERENKLSHHSLPVPLLHM